MKRVRQLIAVFALLLSTSFGMTLAAQDALPVEIAPHDEDYAGASMGEWEARSWQWSVSIPFDFSPSFHPEAGLCGVGQSGPVFFLPGVYDMPSSPDAEVYEITCDVAEGTAIFVGIGGAGCTSVEDEPFFGSNEEELIACASVFTDGLTSSELTINGVEVDDPLQYRHVTPLHTLNFGPGNIYDLEPVVAYSVVDAYGFIVLPPAPGQYIIEMNNTWEGVEHIPPMRWTVSVVSPTITGDEEVPASTPAATPVN